MCSLSRNFIPSATFWKNPGRSGTPIHERLLTRSTIANFSSRLPNLSFNQRLIAPTGLPTPKGNIFHHSPAVWPFSPTQRERRAVVAPRRSCIRAHHFLSIQRIANWEKNSIKNTTLTIAKVAMPNEIVSIWLSSGVPVNNLAVTLSTKLNSKERRSYISSITNHLNGQSPQYMGQNYPLSQEYLRSYSQSLSRPHTEL